MKNLVVYFSLEGNTEYVADKIGNAISADTLKLVPKKAYHDKGFAKFFWGGKSAVMAEKPALEEYSLDPGDYDRIIFGFPVWASNYTPPIRTFIEDNRERLRGKKFAKALDKLAKSLNIEGFEQTAVFIDPKARSSEDTDAKITEFIESLDK